MISSHVHEAWKNSVTSFTKRTRTPSSLAECPLDYGGPEAIMREPGVPENRLKKKNSAKTVQVFALVGAGGPDRMRRGSLWPSEAWSFVLYNSPTRMQDMVASSLQSLELGSRAERTYRSQWYLVCNYLVLRVDSSFQVFYLFFRPRPKFFVFKSPGSLSSFLIFTKLPGAFVFPAFDTESHRSPGSCFPWGLLPVPMHRSHRSPRFRLHFKSVECRPLVAQFSLSSTVTLGPAPRWRLRDLNHVQSKMYSVTRDHGLPSTVLPGFGEHLYSSC